ncbi:MAG: DNA gyrase inhibitor YacG [Phycisphaeraceae bacterium]
MPDQPTDTNGKHIRRGKCPTCGKPVREDEKAFPFCSDRCRTIDLGKWLDEKYVISRPIEQSDLDEE